ncbi:MAG: hypothetical protein AB4063_27130 [Crocosphaera sp.]
MNIVNVLTKKWKKIIFVTSLFGVFLGLGLVINGNRLDNKYKNLSNKLDLLNQEIRVLNRVNEIFKDIQYDRKKLMDLNRLSSINTSYLKDTFSLVFSDETVNPRFRIYPSEVDSICDSLIDITKKDGDVNHREITCNQLKVPDKYVSILTQVSVDDLEQYFTILRARQNTKKKDINHIKLQEIDNNLVFYNLIIGYFLEVVFIPVLLVTLIIFCLDFIKSYRKKLTEDTEQLNKNIEEAQKDLSLNKSPWKNASQVLDAYYKRNLSQLSKIYYTSIIVMIAGFVGIVVSLGIGFSIASNENSNSESHPRIVQILSQNTNLTKLNREQLKILISPQSTGALLITLIGTGSGIITSFIGATFLYLYQLTIRQSTKYTASLAKVNTVGIAMEILSTIETLEDNDIDSNNSDRHNDNEAQKKHQDTVITTKINIASLLIKQLENVEKNN